MGFSIIEKVRQLPSFDQTLAYNRSLAEKLSCAASAHDNGS